MENEPPRDVLQHHVNIEHPPAVADNTKQPQQPTAMQDDMSRIHNDSPSTTQQKSDSAAEHLPSQAPCDTMTVDSAIGTESPAPTELNPSLEKPIGATEASVSDALDRTDTLPPVAASGMVSDADITTLSSTSTIPVANLVHHVPIQTLDNPSPTDTAIQTQDSSAPKNTDHNAAVATQLAPATQDSHALQSEVAIVDPLEQDAFITQDEELGTDVTRKRPESLLTTPLTHPNGVRMFPSLTTSEQEDLAREALNQAQESIVADTHSYSAVVDDMSDGGYESDGFSSASTSAESSVRDYMYENGRRYHAFREGHYNFPNDDVEQEREDMKHAMMKLLCSQKLHFAPIGDNPQQILDIGTGTGIWTIEMGDFFPSAHVLGVDLSPIQPDWLPPNVRFLVDDVESPWLHPRNHFDYIHSRHTVMAIKDWMRLFRRSLEHLKPGGWIELQEIHHKPRSAIPGGTVPPDHPAARFWDLVTEGLGKLGINLDTIADGNLCKMMEDAGFINVTELILHVPIGIWPKNKVLKTVGLYWRTILLDGLQAIALGPLTRGLQWKREEVEVFLTSVRQAHHDNSALMYMPLHIIYAQKPLDMA